MMRSVDTCTHYEVTSCVPRMLERGDIFILYQPVAVDELRAAPSDDHFYVLLHPCRGQNHRLIVMSRSRYASKAVGEEHGSACYWGMIDEIIRTGRHLQEHFVESRHSCHPHDDHALLSMRAAGMGNYTLVQQGDDTHLAYSLMEPMSHGYDVPKLHIAPAATFQICVKHPDAPIPAIVPPEMMSVDEHKPSLPSELLRCFEDRHFISADPPQLLDHEGVEFLLMGIDPALELHEMI